MDIPQILPAVGSPVSTNLLNLPELENASPGEILHAAAILMSTASQGMSDPNTYNKLATFSDAAGNDWAGFQGEPAPTSAGAGYGTATATLEQTEASERNLNEPVQTPLEPDNYCDSLPAIGNMLSQLTRFQDNVLAQYSRYLEASMADQRSYLGTPRKTKDFRDVADYLTSTMKISRSQARKIIRRGKYYAHRPGLHSDAPDAKPVFEQLAESMARGALPVENADKLIDFDEELTKYSHKTNQPLERKDHVLEVFEPVMAETAESTTPDEMSGIKKRWMEEMAHWICPDGPSPSRAFAKEADNALKCREQADGSAIFSMHTSPAVAARFKNWMLQQLDFHGTPARISDEAVKLLDLLTTQDEQPVDEASAQNVEKCQETTAEQDLQNLVDIPRASDTEHSKEQTPSVPGEWLGPMTSWDTSLDPTLVVAETPDGTPLTAREMNFIETLTTGQRMGGIVLSQLLALFSMDPTELGGKKAHGISAQLMIVQDIETAYHTLGYGEIPTAARRPSGADGYLPPVIKLPDPDNPDEPDCLNNPYQYSQQVPPDPDTDDQDEPVPWTQYQSEAVNIGPIHPADAEILMCNAEITGQIWDGPDQVLIQRRAKRLFTASQRRAILARDKGCQAPGCTVPGAYCDIHHLQAWANGGPTDENNGIALCSYHHDATHHGRWVIRKYKGLTFFQPARWIDPSQPLLRNAYWNS